MCVCVHVHRYEDDLERRDRFFYNALNGDGPPPTHCSPEVMSAVALQHTRSPSVWTVIPMQVCFVRRKLKTV